MSITSGLVDTTPAIPSLGRHRAPYDALRDQLNASAFRTPEGRHRGNPDMGPRCGECRLRLGTHNTADPLCGFHGAD